MIAYLDVFYATGSWSVTGWGPASGAPQRGPILIVRKGITVPLS